MGEHQSSKRRPEYARRIARRLSDERISRQTFFRYAIRNRLLVCFHERVGKNARGIKLIIAIPRDQVSGSKYSDRRFLRKRPSRARDVSRKVVEHYLNFGKIRRYRCWISQGDDAVVAVGNSRFRGRNSKQLRRGAPTDKSRKRIDIISRIRVTSRYVPLVIRDLPYWFLRRVTVHHGAASLLHPPSPHSLLLIISLLLSFLVAPLSVGAWSFAFRRSANDDEVGQRERWGRSSLRLRGRWKRGE